MDDKLIVGIQPVEPPEKVHYKTEGMHRKIYRQLL